MILSESPLTIFWHSLGGWGSLKLTYRGPGHIWLSRACWLWKCLSTCQHPSGDPDPCAFKWPGCGESSSGDIQGMWDYLVNINQFSQHEYLMHSFGYKQFSVLTANIFSPWSFLAQTSIGFVSTIRHFDDCKAW